MLSVRSAKPRRYPCPFCGTEESSPTNLWRHKAAKCDKNPNPACDYCGWHYKPGELERHMQRCDYRDNPREATPAAPRARPDPDDAEARDADNDAPAEETTATPARSSRRAQPSAPARAEPAESETDTERAPATAEQERADAVRLRGAARRRALLDSPPGPTPRPPVHLPLDPLLATLALNAEELTRGLPLAQARKLAAPRLPAPVVILQPAAPRPMSSFGRSSRAFAEGLSTALVRLHEKGLVPPPRSAQDEPWERFLDMAEAKLTPEEMDALMEETHEWPKLTKTVIGVTCIPPSEEAREADPLGWLLLGAGAFGAGWLLWKIFSTPKPTPPTQAAPAAAPKERPPYNPALHGSVDAYRATYGSSTAQEAPVGLDAKARQPWRPQA